MIEVKQAIQIAMDRVRELFQASPSFVQDFRLEEVSRTDGGWLVTISFLPNPNARESQTTLAGGHVLSSPTTVIGVDSRRSFKEVELSADGEVKSIRMRPIVLH